MSEHIAGYYSPKELGTIWGINPVTIIRLVREGKLKGFKIGRIYRIPMEAVTQYENRNQVKRGY